MKRKILFCFSCILLSLACSELTIGGEYDRDYGYITKPAKILYIYGGKNEEDYLGKLNASKYDTESIWNEYGRYGSVYNSKSIWNQYGTYGSDYSQYSPFNKHATYPPVLRDKDGTFYGYFTANKYKSKRANYGMIDIICDNYEKIREDIGEWYDVIF